MKFGSITDGYGAVISGGGSFASRIAPDANDELVYQFNNTYANTGTFGAATLTPSSVLTFPKGGIFSGGDLYCYGGSAAGAPTYHLGSSFTISFWMKFNSWHQARPVVKDRGGGNITIGFRMFANAGMNVEFWNATDSTYTTVVSDAATFLMVGAWNHVGVTYDGANMIFYLNGVAGTPVARVGKTTAYNDSLNWQAGAWNITEPLTGWISDLRISNVVRDQAWFTSVFAGYP